MPEEFSTGHKLLKVEDLTRLRSVRVLLLQVLCDCSKFFLVASGNRPSEVSWQSARNMLGRELSRIPGRSKKHQIVSARHVGYVEKRIFENEAERSNLDTSTTSS